MKKILFVRHGKAESASWEIDDLDREITTQGSYDTTLVSNEVLCRLVPDVSKTMMVVSDAKRALQSSEIYMKNWALNEKQRKVWPNLYGDLTTVDFIDYVSHNVSDEIDLLVIVGHNPTLSDLVNQMGEDLDCWMSTAGVVTLELDLDSWSKIEARTAKMQFSLFPSEIR